MQNAVEYIKENMDAEKLLEYYNTNKIKRSGNSIRCCCPIHDSDNPTSFVYSISKGLWFCHADCHTGGDVYDFIMLKDKISFSEAVKKAASIFDLDISTMEIVQRTTDYLKETKDWIKHMLNKLNKKEIKKYDISELGTLYPINSYRNFTKETLEFFGIKYCNHAVLRDTINNRDIYITKRLVVPIYQNGILVAVTLRRTINQPIKWMHQPVGVNMGDYIYNIDNIKTNIGQPMVIVEGCGDVWNLHQHGFTNTGGLFGSSLKEQQEKILITKTYDLLLALDGDYAGIKGTLDIINRLKYKMNIKIAQIPISKDIGELRNEDLQHIINNPLTTQQWTSQEYVQDAMKLSMKQWNEIYIGGV